MLRRPLTTADRRARTTGESLEGFGVQGLQLGVQSLSLGVRVGFQVLGCLFYRVLPEELRLEAENLPPPTPNESWKKLSHPPYVTLDSALRLLIPVWGKGGLSVPHYARDANDIANEAKRW